MGILDEERLEKTLEKVTTSFRTSKFRLKRKEKLMNESSFLRQFLRKELIEEIHKLQYKPKRMKIYKAYNQYAVYLIDTKDNVTQININAKEAYSLAFILELDVTLIKRNTLPSRTYQIK